MPIVIKIAKKDELEKVVREELNATLADADFIATQKPGNNSPSRYNG